MKGNRNESVKENFAQAHERYTIMTAVPSWRMDGPSADTPPKMAILFRGKKGGRIRDKILREFQKPDWMEIQVQENGSYRSEDMVEFLEWALPQANSSKESIVVLLDWYAGHLTQEVGECVRRKGHVLLFHGGGTTAFTQVNDTHLHAMVQRLMEQIEVQWARDVLEDARADGKRKIPNPKRPDICAWVQAMWGFINHERVAAKGYTQTFPAMAMDGPVQREDIFKDLLEVLDKIDPPENPDEVGISLREEAKRFVKEGYEAHRWRTWEESYKLIEVHDDGDEADVEGQEAFNYKVREDREEDDPDDDNSTTDSEDTESEGSSAGGHGDRAGQQAPSLQGQEQAPAHQSQDQAACRQGDDGTDDHLVYEPTSPAEDGDEAMGSIAGEDGGVAPAGAEQDRQPADSRAHAPRGIPKEAAPTPFQVGEATRVMTRDAMDKHDDPMLRRMLRKAKTGNREQREGGSAAADVLRHMQKKTDEALYKRRKEIRDSDRQAADASANAAAARDQASKENLEARTRWLAQMQVKNREAEKAKHKDRESKAYQKWLQTEFAVIMAETLIKDFDAMTAGARRNFRTEVARGVTATLFARRLDLPDLWEPDPTLTLSWGTVKRPHGRPHVVRCGIKFQQIFNDYAPFPHGILRDVADAMLRLFGRFMPCAARIFVDPFTPLSLLATNNFVMEKAFVYGLVLLSKWLGSERWPVGLYGAWPPPAPGHVRVSAAAAEPSWLDDSVAALAVADVGCDMDEEHLEPCGGMGDPASSSHG